MIVEPNTTTGDIGTDCKITDTVWGGKRKL